MKKMILFLTFFVLELMGEGTSQASFLDDEKLPSLAGMFITEILIFLFVCFVLYKILKKRSIKF